MLSKFDRKLELLDGFETSYLRILYYDFPNYYKGSYKSYEYNRLCTIIEGEKNVKIDNKDSFKYDKNQFVLLPPNSKVDMEMNIPTKALVLELNNHLIEKVGKKVTLDFKVESDIVTDNNLFIGQDSNILNNSVLNILSIHNSSETNKEFLIDLYAQEMTYNLLRNKGIHQILNYEHNNPVQIAINYMKKNYHEPISIKDMACNLNMSQSNFSVYFKNISGVSPNEYLKNIRLTKAKEMLIEQNVTEVAYNLGYQNISHFIRLFKSKYGVTPKQYKTNLMFLNIS